MSEQLALSFDGEMQWDHDRRLLVQMAQAIGLKVCAVDLAGGSESALGHSLYERGRNLPASWIRYLVSNAPIEFAREYVQRLAGERRLRVVDAPPLTPTEELAALKDAMSRCLGPEMREVILRKALEHGPPAREGSGR